MTQRAPATLLRKTITFMAGTVLVTHNFNFEEVEKAAARRERIPLPPVLRVCTLQTERQQLDGRLITPPPVMNRGATGEFSDQPAHRAGDARAIREILLWLLANAPAPGGVCTPHPRQSQSPTLPSAKSVVTPVLLTNSSIHGHIIPSRVEHVPGMLLKSKSTFSAPGRKCVEDGRLTFDEAQSLTCQHAALVSPAHNLRDSPPGRGYPMRRTSELD